MTANWHITLAIHVTAKKKTEYTLNDLLHGEQYEIEVDSVSHRVLSKNPLSIEQIIEPEAIHIVDPILGKYDVPIFV